MTREEWFAELDKIFEQYEKEKQERYKELGIENRYWFGKEARYCQDLLEKRWEAIQELNQKYIQEHPEEAPGK